MRPSSCKAKGRRGAKEVKAKIHVVFPALGDDDVQVTSSGKNGEDIVLSPRARAFLPISPECKVVEKLNIWSALEQAEENADVYEPVVFFRRNRCKMYAAIDAHTLLELYAIKDKYEENRLNELTSKER